jgi:hypothetical protein
MKTQTPQQTLSVSVKHEVSLENISNLLCSAFEGGSNYWYVINEFVEPKALTFRTDKDQVYRHLDYPLNEGGAVIVGDMEDTDAEAKTLDLKAIQKGLKIMAEKYPRHMSDFVNDNDDAITGDVFLQCCLFGEVIYG